MALPTEALMALLTALLIAGPMVVLWRAWLHARGRRALLASCGFTAFFVTDLLLVVGNAFGPSGLADASEVVELAGDIVTAGLFAAAFLLPPGSHGFES